MGHARRHIPNNLRRYRRMYGYKQKEVMALLKLKSTNRISRWEKGLSMPNLNNLFKLCALYQTLAEELYYDLYSTSKQHILEQHRLLVSEHSLTPMKPKQDG